MGAGGGAGEESRGMWTRLLYAACRRKRARRS